MHMRVLEFNQDLNQAATANLQYSAGTLSTNLKLYESTQAMLAEPKLEKVFRSYLFENPLHRVYDLEEEKIEVEYMHGFYNDIRHMVEFDKKARLHLQSRRQSKFTFEELLRWLDSQRLSVPYFRRICQMETSPRDLIIKAMWPNGHTDIFDWGLR